MLCLRFLLGDMGDDNHKNTLSGLLTGISPLIAICRGAGGGDNGSSTIATLTQGGETQPSTHPAPTHWVTLLRTLPITGRF